MYTLNGRQVTDNLLNRLYQQIAHSRFGRLDQELPGLARAVAVVLGGDIDGHYRSIDNVVRTAVNLVAAHGDSPTPHEDIQAMFALYLPQDLREQLF